MTTTFTSDPVGFNLLFRQVGNTQTLVSAELTNDAKTDWQAAINTWLSTTEASAFNAELLSSNSSENVTVNAAQHVLFAVGNNSGSFYQNGTSSSGPFTISSQLRSSLTAILSFTTQPNGLSINAAKVLSDIQNNPSGSVMQRQDIPLTNTPTTNLSQILNAAAFLPVLKRMVSDAYFILTLDLSGLLNTEAGGVYTISENNTTKITFTASDLFDRVIVSSDLTPVLIAGTTLVPITDLVLAPGFLTINRNRSYRFDGTGLSSLVVMPKITIFDAPIGSDAILAFPVRIAVADSGTTNVENLPLESDGSNGTSNNTGPVDLAFQLNVLLHNGSGPQPLGGPGPLPVDMILTITTSTANYTIDLPISGIASSVSVDWGDGTPIQTVNTRQPPHTFASAGSYTIVISGVFTHYGRGYFNTNGNFQDLGNNGTETVLTGITQWGSYITSLHSAFRNVSTNFTIPNKIPPIVTDLHSMFRNASSFDQFTIGNWDVSNVTEMDSVFRDASSFNRNLNNWEVSRVTNMRRMFFGATAYNKNMGAWDVRRVTSMRQMFHKATNFNQNLNNWDVVKVSNMRQMFQLATSFNKNLFNWNVRAVTNMTQMFRDASNFNKNIADWNVSRATNMSQMFRGATKFNRNISGWDVRRVSNLSRFIQDAINFNFDLGAWDVAPVCNVSNFSNGATKYNNSGFLPPVP